MVRCNILYFRSRSDNHDTLLHGKVSDFEDPVAWLVEALDVSLAVARHRLAQAKPKEAPTPKAARKAADRWHACEKPRTRRSRCSWWRSLPLPCRRCESAGARGAAPER